MSRFYIPRRRSPILDIAGLALRYADIKQRGDIAKTGQKLTERELELRERESKSEYGFDMQTKHPTEGVISQHVPGLAERRVKTGERHADIAESEAERKERDYTVQWERRMDEPPQPANLINLKDKMPAFAPMINSILEGIQSGKINTRWDAYYDRKQNETMDLKTARDAVEKQISKATKEGKHTEAAQLGQLYNALKPGFLEDFFGFPKALRESRPEMALEAPTTKDERLYETAEGWQEREKAIGKKKPIKPTTGKTPKEKGLKEFSDLYKYHIGQYNQASRGVGQFIEDPNKERVARESLKRAITIAIQHKKAGGNPADLGITPEAIKQQYKAGNLKKDKAVAALQILFGME